MESVEFRAMNTEIVLAAEGSPVELKSSFENVIQFIQDSERRFTRFSQDSELSQLNNSNGAWFTATPDFFEVIQLTQSYIEETRGLFNPAILPDLNRIGYNRSMDLIRKTGIQADNIPLLPVTRTTLTYDEILLKPEERLISLPMGISLDLGGIAKGWIAQKAATILSENSSACGVSAGGDMYLIGLPNQQPAWQVALDNPLVPGENIAILNIPPGAVATSSVAKRTWSQGGKQRHHLIDPRTGEPAETSWLSVTVISSDLCLSEVFAKTLLIAPSRDATHIADDAGIDFLAVDRNGNIVGTKKSLEYINEQ